MFERVISYLYRVGGEGRGEIIIIRPASCRIAYPASGNSIIAFGTAIAAAAATLPSARNLPEPSRRSYCFGRRLHLFLACRLTRLRVSPIHHRRRRALGAPTNNYFTAAVIIIIVIIIIIVVFKSAVRAKRDSPVNRTWRNYPI